MGPVDGIEKKYQRDAVRDGDDNGCGLGHVGISGAYGARTQTKDCNLSPVISSPSSHNS